MPVCVFDVFADGTTRVPADTALKGPGVYRWWHYDLGDPEFAPWAAERLTPISAGTLLQAETRPRCDRYLDGLLLNLRGINLNTGQDADEMISVRIWVEEGAIVTGRRQKVFATDAIRLAAEAGDAPRNVSSFLQELISTMTLHIQQEVSRIDLVTDFYEDNLEDKSSKMPPDLADNRRNVMRLRRYLEPQRVALSKLATLDMAILPETSTLQLRELANRSVIAVEELDELRDRLGSVENEHENLIAQRMARHSYAISIAAAVFLPLTFITGLFGVNVGGMPGIESPIAFAVLCLAMLGLSVLLLAVLKLLRWI